MKKERVFSAENKMKEILRSRNMMFSHALAPLSTNLKNAKLLLLLSSSSMCDAMIVVDVCNKLAIRVQGQWAIWINGFQSFAHFIDDFMCGFRSVNDVIATYIGAMLCDACVAGNVVQ